MDEGVEKNSTQQRRNGRQLPFLRSMDQEGHSQKAYETDLQEPFDKSKR